MERNCIRVLDSNIIYEISPLFIEDGCYDRSTMEEEFIATMNLYPDDICVVISRDGENINGFLVAHTVCGRDFCYLAQAYSRLYKEIAEEGMVILESWAKGLGLNEIRAETEKDSVAHRAFRNWDFKEHSIVMSRFI